MSRLRNMPIEVMVCLCCVTAVEVMLRWHDIKNVRTGITLWMKKTDLNQIETLYDIFFQTFHFF